MAKRTTPPASDLQAYLDPRRGGTIRLDPDAFRQWQQAQGTGPEEPALTSRNAGKPAPIAPAPILREARINTTPKED